MKIYKYQSEIRHSGEKGRKKIRILSRRMAPSDPRRGFPWDFRRVKITLTYGKEESERVKGETRARRSLSLSPCLGGVASKVDGKKELTRGAGEKKRRRRNDTRPSVQFCVIPR